MTSRVSQAAAGCAATAGGEATTLRPPTPVDADESERVREAPDGCAAASASAADARQHRQPDGNADTRASENTNSASRASYADAGASCTGHRGPAASEGRGEPDDVARERHVSSPRVTRMAPVGACSLHRTVTRRRDW